MDVSIHHDLRHDDALARPWRTLALLAAAVAAVELFVLIIVGGALIAKPSAAHKPVKKTKAAVSHAAPQPAPPPRAAAHRAKPAPVAHLTRAKVSVLVLNGNGRQGAAAATAVRVKHRGYRIEGVANASRRDFTRTLVMYRRGFEGEGRRLARDLSIGIVGPLDGIRSTQLHGAHTVIVVGA